MKNDYIPSELNLKRAVYCGLPDLFKGIFLIYPLLFWSKRLDPFFGKTIEFGEYPLWKKVRTIFNLANLH